MKILGIETSCDETSAAVVEETGDAAKPWAIRSNVIASQVAIHREWGGVVPELASRAHVEAMPGILKEALAQEPGFQDLMRQDPRVKEVLDVAQKIEGLARNAGIHAAGVVISPQAGRHRHRTIRRS